MKEQIVIYKITNKPLTSLELKYGVLQIEPIMGGRLSAESYWRHLAEYYSNTKKIISPSELGCTLSHIKIYEKSLECDSGSIILEEDIETTEESLISAISLCQESGVDFIHLGWHPGVYKGTYFKGIYDHSTKLYRVNPYSKFYGTYSYYVSKRMASELINFHRSRTRKADAWGDFFEFSKIDPYFKGIFFHPNERGEVYKERKIKNNLNAISKFYISARNNIKQALYFLRGYRNIKPNKLPARQ